MAILIAGSIRVSAQKREFLLTAIRKYVVASRAEPGCEHYDWTADLAEPEKIHVFEQWADEASLKRHFEGNAYTETAKLIAKIGMLGADISKYRVDLIEPVYDGDGRPRADFFTG